MSGPDSSLTPWAVRAIDELHSADRRANELARRLSTRQLIWKPSPDAWSIGQCLQHLLVANRVYLPPIATALDGQRPSPVQEITPPLFGRWFIRNYIEPSAQTRRSRAPRKIAPGPDVDPAVLDLFLRSNEDARELFTRASTYDVNLIRFRNPFIPLLSFTVGTGIEIVWRHQRRHLLQAERVRQASGFPEPR